MGRALTEKLINKGYQVVWLSRKIDLNAPIPRYYWDYKTNKIDEEPLRKTDVIIHLAGENIGAGRWTNKRKETIIESRVNTTKLLFETLKKINKKPEVFISASAVGIYGNNINEKIYTEADQSETNDFLTQVCEKWENSADKLGEELGCRTVKIRTSMVISPESEAFRKMLLPIKLSVGSPIGSGNQYVSWIHIDDLCQIYMKAVEDETMSGAYNAVGSEHITNKKFMETFAKVMQKPFFFPNIPSFAMRILMGESADLVLGGSRISNEKLTSSNFTFQYQTAESALQQAVLALNKNR